MGEQISRPVTEGVGTKPTSKKPIIETSRIDKWSSIFVEVTSKISQLEQLIIEEQIAIGKILDHGVYVDSELDLEECKQELRQLENSLQDIRGLI